MRRRDLLDMEAESARIQSQIDDGRAAKRDTLGEIVEVERQVRGRLNAGVIPVCWGTMKVPGLDGIKQWCGNVCACARACMCFGDGSAQAGP